MIHKYTYTKKIQPNHYIKSALPYEPFEISCEADTFEEAEAEVGVGRLIRKKLEDLKPKKTNEEKFINSLEE
jgi:hypothetical protein